MTYPVQTYPVHTQMTGLLSPHLTCPARHLAQTTVATVAGVFARSCTLASNVSVAATNTVASIQSGVMDAAWLCRPTVLKETAAHAVRRVGLGGCLFLAAPFVIPAIGTLANSIRRARRARQQRHLNAQAFFKAHNRRGMIEQRQPQAVAHLKRPAELLREHAALLKQKGQQQKVLAERKTSLCDGLAYVATLAAPLCALPQVAALAGLAMATPATPAIALPLALGLGVAGCAARWAMNRFDTSKERAQAEDFFRQSDWYEQLAKKEEWK